MGASGGASLRKAGRGCGTVPTVTRGYFGALLRAAASGAARTMTPIQKKNFSVPVQALAFFSR